MRTLHRLGRDLAGFIAGHEHGICVLQAERDHLPWVYATLQELDATSPDLFLPIPHPFASADAYATTVADACLIIARERTRDPGLALPPECSERGRSAVARVQTILACARDVLLPRRVTSPRLVPVLIPLSVESEAAALEFALRLIAPDRAWPPWFHRMRIFVHVPPETSLGTLPRFVRTLAVDLSLSALAEGVRETASDPGAPPEQRAQALLQAAAMDAASGRHEQALAGYRQLHASATAMGNPVLAALALSGTGDVHCIRKDRLEAVSWYERALVPASEAGAALLMLVVTQNLARLYFELGRHADAELFFDGAQRLAMAVPDAASHAQALQWRGRLQELRGAREQAATSYLAAARVARDHDQRALLRELRPRLAGSQRRVSALLARAIAAFLEEGR